MSTQLQKLGVPASYSDLERPELGGLKISFLVGTAGALNVNDTPYTPLEKGVLESRGLSVLELTESEARGWKPNVMEMRSA